MELPKGCSTGSVFDIDRRQKRIPVRRDQNSVRELDLKYTSEFEAHRLRVIEPMKKLKTDWNNVPLPLVETI